MRLLHDILELASIWADGRDARHQIRVLERENESLLRQNADLRRELTAAREQEMVSRTLYNVKNAEAARLAEKLRSN